MDDREFYDRLGECLYLAAHKGDPGPEMFSRRTANDLARAFMSEATDRGLLIIPNGG